MTIMTKRGVQDNVPTYEHWCDTAEDLAKIDPQYITLGSVAVVVNGGSDLDIYLATSDKSWQKV